MEATKTNVVDDGNSPEFYVSGLMGISHDGPNVQLAFATNRVRQDRLPLVPIAEVNVRIILPAEALQAMLDFVAKNLATKNLVAMQVPPDQPLQ